MTGAAPTPVTAGTLTGLVLEGARRWGPRPAITVAGRTLTYRDLPGHAERYATALAGGGVRPGDRVAIIAPNSPAVVDAFLGCLWCGAALVPLDPGLRGASLDRALATTRPDHLLPDRPLQATEGRSARPRTADIAPDTPAAVLFTSGSTGASKAVVCPHSQLLAWGTTVGTHLELGPDDVLWTTLPLHHTNALNAVVQALTWGAQIVIGARFSVSSYWQRAAEHGATVGYLLGSLVPRLLAAAPAGVDRTHRMTRMLAPGVSPLARAELEARFGVRTLDGYGSTETNYVIGGPLDRARPGWMGRLLPGYRARLAPVDDDPGHGELLLAEETPGAFATGYLGEELYGPDGWFRTGDQVRLEGGWYRFEARLTDVIRRHGENIQAREVEEILTAHPLVAQACVIGHRDGSETDVHAFLVPARPAAGSAGSVDGEAVDLEAVLAYATANLPPFAVPRYVDVLAELPVTASEKPDRPALRARGLGPDTWRSR